MGYVAMCSRPTGIGGWLYASLHYNVEKRLAFQYTDYEVCSDIRPTGTFQLHIVIEVCWCSVCIIVIVLRAQSLR